MQTKILWPALISAVLMHYLDSYIVSRVHSLSVGKGLHLTLPVYAMAKLKSMISFVLSKWKALSETEVYQ